MRLDVQRGYSRVEAAFYERWLAAGVCAAGGSVIADVVRSISAGDRVADVGCGGGRVLQAIQRAAPTVRLVGIDPSGFELAAARRRLPGEAALVRGSAAALPFRSNTFDATVSFCSIKHWPDPARGVAECVRITRPGGLLVIVELDGDASLAEWRRFIASTDVPAFLAPTYARASHRLVVRWSTTARDLSAAFGEIDVSGLRVEQVADQPMVIAVAAVT